MLDELDLYEDAIAALAAALEPIGSRPVLLLGLVRDVDGQPQLAGLIERWTCAATATAAWVRSTSTA